MTFSLNFWIKIINRTRSQFPSPSQAPAWEDKSSINKAKFLVCNSSFKYNSAGLFRLELKILNILFASQAGAWEAVSPKKNPVKYHFTVFIKLMTINTYLIIYY